jgi:anti-sigma B factor antagonist
VELWLVQKTRQGGKIMCPRRLPTLPKVERSDNITIFTFIPNAMRNVENVIARELGGLTEGAGARHLLLDFTHVKCLNSMELGTLVTLHKRIKETGGRLTLFNLSAQVFELFALTRLDTLLGICREDPHSNANLHSADATAIPDPHSN